MISAALLRSASVMQFCRLPPKKYSSPAALPSYICDPPHQRLRMMNARSASAGAGASNKKAGSAGAGGDGSDDKVDGGEPPAAGEWTCQWCERTSKRKCVGPEGPDTLCLACHSLHLDSVKGGANEVRCAQHERVFTRT